MMPYRDASLLQLGSNIVGGGINAHIALCHNGNRVLLLRQLRYLLGHLGVCLKGCFSIVAHG